MMVCHDPIQGQGHGEVGNVRKWTISKVSE